MDLYSTAASLPWRLPIGEQALSYRQLRERGLSSPAIRWRTGRGDRIHRVHRGIYLLDPELPDLLGSARAALLAASPLAVLGFHTAALLHGFGVAEADAIHLLLPAGTPFPQRRGVAAHQAVLPVGRPEPVMGLPCAPAARCAVDLARTLPRRDALPVLDAALFSGAVQRDDLLREITRHSGLRGIRQARELGAVADGRSECRQETQLRLLLHDAGFIDLVPQLPVLDDFGHVRCRLDLADQARQIAVEYDGSSHLDRHRLGHDRARHNWLQQRGWLVCYFTAADLYLSPARIPETVAAARRSRTYRRDWRSTNSNNP